MLARWKRRHREVFGILSQWLGLHPEELNAAANLADQGRYERRFQSQSGRDLQVPEGSLYTVQSRLHQVFLRLAPISSAAHGGVPGRSILTHARVHLPGAHSLLSMDIRRAYENARAHKIAEALRRLLKGPCREMLIESDLRALIADYLTLVCTVDKRLPLGAPSSPALFNLVANPLDKSIERMIREIGPDLRYSRYLDDLVISSPTILPKTLIAKIKRTIQAQGLGSAHPTKTNLALQAEGHELSVTGVIHDGSGFAIARQRLGELEYAMKEALEGESPELARGRGIYSFIKSIYGPKRVPSSIENLAGRHLGALQ
jgi:hypothetical protein